MKIAVPAATAALISNLHPQLKQVALAGVQSILAKPTRGRPLKDNLAGLYSYRIKKLIIVYRVNGKKKLEIIALGPRRTIYRETYRLIHRLYGPLMGVSTRSS